MKPGRERSADSLLGWISHYQRMKRWEQRAQSVAVREIVTQTPETVDFALAYFIWAHSFREWLLESGALPKDALDSYLSTKGEWNLCRDLANRCRHYDLTRSPKDNDFVISYRIDIGAAIAGAKNQIIPGVFHNGLYLEFTQAIGQISLMWEGVIDNFGLQRERQ